MVLVIVAAGVASLTAFSQREDVVATFKKNEIKGLSKYLDGATGGIIVVLQTLIFLVAFSFAPKHGMLAARRRSAESLAGEN
mgnify:CR=1 FL=1